MVSNRSSRRALRRVPRGSGFLLGGVSAALVVLTVAGASLVVSGSHAGRAVGELGYDRLPRLELSLQAIPSAPAHKLLG
jgi:hypothetical protein